MHAGAHVWPVKVAFVVVSCKIGFAGLGVFEVCRNLQQQQQTEADGLWKPIACLFACFSPSVGRASSSFFIYEMN